MLIFLILDISYYICSFLLLQALSCIDDDFKDSFLYDLMDKVTALSEDAAKREQSDQMTLLIRSIRDLLLARSDHQSQQRKLVKFNSFWLEYTRKGLVSGSLVLRLFSWDQVHDIVQEAIASRFFAESYIVSGAGNEDANGTYKYDRIDVEGAPQYIKEPTKPDMPQLTLFRCTMRNKCKWWFISQVDKEKPGTEKDIDYYQHKSRLSEEREPPCFEWGISSTNNNTRFSTEPAPTLTRVGTIVPEGVGIETNLSYSFPAWVLANDLLGLAFRTSPHREIVARSCKLVQFLADTEQLLSEHLQLIWKAAIQCHDVDIIDEIFGLLASVSSSLTDDLYATLMDLALNTITQTPAESSASSSPTGISLFNKVAFFVEKFAKESARDMLSSLSEASASRLLSVVWTVYKSPQFEGLKSSNVIQDFLSKCLGLPCGKLVALKSARECMRQLVEFSSPSGSNNNSTSAIELAAARVNQTLRFLLSRNMTVEHLKALGSEQLTDILVAEVNRFVLANRPGPTSSTSSFDVRWYSTELRSRLQTIRHIYGLFDEFSILMSTLEGLWELLSSNPVELDAFFWMLRSGITRDTDQIPFADFNQLLLIFRSILCSALVKWVQCGEEAFSCFSAYFHALDFKTSARTDLNLNLILHPSDLPPRYGVDTLWEIVLYLPSEHAASQKNAVDLLIKSYEDYAIDTTDAHWQLSNKIFSLLEGHLSTLPSMTDVEATRAQDVLVRLLDLLDTAINKSTPSLSFPHSLCSSMSRMRLNVSFRKVINIYNYSAQNNTGRTEKGSEMQFILETHPMQTVGNLRVKIAEHVKTVKAQKLFLEGTLKGVSDHRRLNELGLIDGSEVSCNALSNSAVTTAYDYDNVIEFDNRILSSIADTISSSQDHFDLLLTLADLNSMPTVARLSWRILMTIPTQPEFLDQVRSLALEASPSGSKPDWSSLLRGPSLFRNTYIAQIMDYTLQPGADIRDDDTSRLATIFKEHFIRTGGFSAILDFFVSTPSFGDLSDAAVSTSLHILRYLMFSEPLTDSSSPESQSLSQSSVAEEGNKKLVAEFQSKSDQALEQLLAIANAAAIVEETVVVGDALSILNFLLRTPETASLLIGNSKSKSLLVTVLKNPSIQVREMACDFAVQVGKSQPVVFSWLLAEMKQLQEYDDMCSEIFDALRTLVTVLHSTHRKSVDWAELANILATKLLEYGRNPPLPPASNSYASFTGVNKVLLGTINLLDTLIRTDGTIATTSGIDLVVLTKTLLDDYLFVIPSASSSTDKNPLCDVGVCKQATYRLLGALCSVSSSVFKSVYVSLSQFSSQAAVALGSKWGQQISYDIRRSDVSFAGLKNQGCTCYINALIQQLFMSVPFREAILSTPIKECDRQTSFHRVGEELVGCVIRLDPPEGEIRDALVMQYFAAKNLYLLEYLDNKQQIHLSLRSGHVGKEANYLYTLAPLDGDEEMNERDRAACHVLEQLQRTFCFMQHSKRRFFDPKPFVDACKTLNLNFNVYHQNDACEFADQLLDRIENATKGRYTGVDVWNNTFQKSIYGGKFLTQKIPQECDVYQTDKKGCGHWQSSRQESFLKVELIIRGKENIDESLADLVAGELMDGDNKINCEVCSQKKATVRRTCFEKLPNMLILHLKRFDLDFTTFETVKLNNRMAFETHINMLKYTKEGMESEDRRKLRELNKETDADADDQSPPMPADDDDFVEPNPLDYEYELQGVLVHAGVAQGGHYYSFIRDTAYADKWYRFDDEEVSAFTPDQIPFQCFGGPAPVTTTNAAGVSQTFEEDRTANALILFFNKVKSTNIDSQTPVVPESTAESESAPAVVTQSTDASAPTLKTSALIDGHQAFIREVRDWNMQHLLSRYMLDPDLHTFVRSMLASVILSHTGSDTSAISDIDTNDQQLNVLQWYNKDDKGCAAIPNAVIHFAIKFLFDVVLHCRERAAIRAWVTVLRQAFDTFPDAAIVFLHSLIVETTTYKWLEEYLAVCTDALARASFVQVVSQAVLSLASTLDVDRDVLIPIINDPSNTAFRLPEGSLPYSPQQRLECSLRLFAGIVQKLCLFVVFAPSCMRVADEIFALIREVAAVPCICNAFIDQRIISYLAYFAIPDLVDQLVRSHFERLNAMNKKKNIDYFPLLQGVFEAMAALLGVPQIRKVSLLQERSVYDMDLVPDARAAFSTIFTEVSPQGGMDVVDIVQYREKTGVKATPQQARVLLDRFPTTTAGRLSLEGFVQYYADLASYCPKDAWRDLHFFGFKNDLSRSSTAMSVDENSGLVDLTTPLELPDTCRECLFHLQLFQLGLEASEASTKAIVKRICAYNKSVSVMLIRQALQKYRELAPEWTWGTALTLLSDFLRLLLAVPDDLMKWRLTEILLMPSIGFAGLIASES